MLAQGQGQEPTLAQLEELVMHGVQSKVFRKAWWYEEAKAGLERWLRC